MKRHFLAATLALSITLVLSAGGTTACGGDNVCKQADEIQEDCTPPPTPGATTPSPVDRTRRACEGENEAESRCIVDHKDAFCAFLKNPSDADPNNAYSKCSAEAR